MKKILSVLLIIVGIAAIAYGWIDYQESQELIEIGELEVEAGQQKPQQSTILYWIGGGVAIVAGLLTWPRK